MSLSDFNPRSATERSPHGALEIDLGMGAADAVDASLIHRVLGSDHSAMAEIFDRYGSLVYSIALRILKDPGQAEDILQEILLQVWKHPAKFANGRGSLPAWLAVVARNRSIDLLRKRRPIEPVSDLNVASPENLASEVERNTMIEKVRNAMKDLPMPQQRLIELAFFEGMTHSEIAARTGEPLGTVKTRIRTALATLRKGIDA
ncbi:MAG: sigma-70 family RNA polymerase sigma factor [Terracidiphilus sp.]